MMRTAFFTSVAALALAAPMAAGAQVRTLNQQEVAKAAQEHQAVIAEFGGAETGARATYVQNVGAKVGYYSGITNAQQSLHFTTLNSPVENAFAVPGGYIYITRQLMGLMDNESELAFVLGHETGHIAANHAKSRNKVATRNQVLGVLGGIVGSLIGGSQIGDYLSQFAQQASELNTLKFSRTQEYQADQLGIRYMTAAGYDPTGSATMLSALGRATALEARVQGADQRKTPEWASTHPNSANRVAQATQLARATGKMGHGVTNRDTFLAQLEGVTVDDDPAQGVIDGRIFTHPDLRLQFAIPTGFLMQNGTDAVTIDGSAGQAQFSTGQYNGNPSQYIAQVLQGLTGGQQQIPMQQIQQSTVNGLPMYYTTGRANTNNGAVDVGVFVYQFGPNTAYHFVTLTQAGQGAQPFAQMINSVHRISDAEAAAVKPRVIDVVTVGRGDTIASLASKMAYKNYQVDRFLSLNGLASNAQLVPGQKVKLVVYGSRR